MRENEEKKLYLKLKSCISMVIRLFTMLRTSNGNHLNTKTKGYI